MKGYFSFPFFSFWSITVLFIIIAHPFLSCASDKAYVTDSLEITVRRGQGTEYKILQILQTGDQVEVLEEEGGWSKVLLESGVEGWLLSRFLTREEPAATRVKHLALENQQLQNTVSSLATEKEQLLKENANLKQSLAELGTNSENLQKEVQQLKFNSTDFLTLQKEYDLLKSLHVRLQDTYKRYRMKHEDSLDRHLWMIFGVGILVFGMIVGALSKRSSSGKGRSLIQ